MHESIAFALSVAARLVPALQLLQKLFPLSSWYLPASQGSQSPSSFAPSAAPYLPAWHEIQAAATEAAEYLPTTQLMQSESALEPVVAT
jgi:hypothetical protein